MKRILISGGSRGIGACLVRGFCKMGHRVAFFYRENRQSAAAVAAESGAVAVQCDISDPAAVLSGVKEARDALGGGIDILIHNAGVAHFGPLCDLTDAAWRQVLDTSLSGAVYLTRAVQKDMIAAGGGRVILIGSMWGKVGASCEAAYSAAKAGLRGFTMAMAKELGPSKVTVNCVEPGFIDTDMNARLDAATRAALVDETPLCRVGTPEDVFAAVAFLASDAAGFITGQCLGVDGGFAI